MTTRDIKKLQTRYPDGVYMVVCIIAICFTKSTKAIIQYLFGDATCTRERLWEQNMLHDRFEGQPKKNSPGTAYFQSGQ
jgi:hypothetical protein